MDRINDLFKKAQPQIRVNIENSDMQEILDRFCEKHHFAKELSIHAESGYMSRPILDTGSLSKGEVTRLISILDDEDEPSMMMDALVSDFLGYSVSVEGYENESLSFDLSMSLDQSKILAFVKTDEQKMNVYRLSIGDSGIPAGVSMCFDIQAMTKEKAIKIANEELSCGMNGHDLCPSPYMQGAENWRVYFTSGVTKENIVDEQIGAGERYYEEEDENEPD